jgi:ATP-dependent Clp protease protease subunit
MMATKKKTTRRKRARKYYDLHEGRNIMISGEICDEMAPDIITSILLMAKEDPEEEVRLFINTHGGDLNVMFAIHDVIRSIPCPIHTIGMGHVMSAGTLLLACGKRRSIYEHTIVMMHEPIFSVEELRIDSMKKELAINKVMRDKMMALSAKYMGMDVKQLEADLASGDKYFTAEEAVKYGLADDVIKIYKS